MRTLLICFIGVLLFVFEPTYLYGQEPQPDFYRTASGRIRSPSEVEAARRAYQHRMQQDARLREWQRSLNSSMGASSLASDLYKNGQQLVKTLITPTEQERSTYKQLLGHSNTGIFTLLNQNGCMRKIEDEKQEAFAETSCLDKTLPGDGNQFSFRKENYTFLGHADLGLSNDWFFGFGYITQTILVDLGDMPLSDVSLVRDDLRYLTDFVPAATLEEANKQRAELENGMLKNDRQFFSAVRAVTNHTYVLRSIAYRGEFLTEIKVGKETIKLDRLKGDKRGDITVVFRVLGKDDGGNIRILWQRLQFAESPKINLPVTVVDGNNVKKIVKIVN